MKRIWRHRSYELIHLSRLYEYNELVKLFRKGFSRIKGILWPWLRFLLKAYRLIDLIERKLVYRRKFWLFILINILIFFYSYKKNEELQFVIYDLFAYKVLAIGRLSCSILDHFHPLMRVWFVRKSWMAIVNKPKRWF